jgi:acyl-CoA reductase-like NAD-dependent aldehyde dehydrogenase
MDKDTQMGPVISLASRARIKAMVDDAITREKAKLLTGGVIPDLPPPFDKGSFYAPTILEVDTNMQIWREEVFGPVVVAVKFRTEEEAIDLANDSPYGLAAAIWTKDVSRSHRVANRLDVGIIWINGTSDRTLIFQDLEQIFISLF